MQPNFRIAVGAAGVAGLLAAGMLATPFIANASQAPASRVTSATSTTRMPLSARQMLADWHQHRHAASLPGAITGSVQAPDGQPIQDVCVQATGPSGSRSTATRADGRFLVTGLKPGAYRLRYSGCGITAGYAAQWYGGQASHVLVGAAALRPLTPVTMQTAAQASGMADVISPAGGASTAQSVRAALGMPSYTASRPAPRISPAAVSYGGRVAGTVRSPSGRGLAGICVEVVSANGYNQAFTRTGAAGHYQTGQLPAGQYAAAFFADCGNNGNWIAQVYNNANPFKPTLIRVRHRHTTAGINATLRVGAEITGTVTGAAGPKLSNVCVVPIARRGPQVTLFVGGVAVRGSYRLRGLPDAGYKLFFTPCGPSSRYVPTWWPHANTRLTARLIRINRPVIVRHVDAALPVGGVISGTVTDQSNGPLQGICATPNGGPSGGLYGLYWFSQNGLASTGASGTYKVAGLAQSSYQLQFFTGCGNNGNYLPTTNPRHIRLADGQVVAGIDAHLRTGATLSGVVTSAASGKPLRGICVSLSDRAGNYYNPATTNTAGGYRFQQLTAGTYYVQFSGGCGNPGSYAPLAYDNANAFLPQPITIAADGEHVTGIDAALQPGATITGSVRNSSRRNLSGMCVGAFSTANGYGGLASSRNGRYSIPNLLPGQYVVSFQPGCNNNADYTAATFGSALSPSFVSAPVGTTSGIDGVLHAAGNISGQLVSKDGRAQPFTCVSVTGLTAATAGSVGNAFSNSSGSHYELTGLLPGPYQVSYQPGCILGSPYANQWYKDRPSPAGAARIMVRAGHTVTGISSALTRGGVIAGQVSSGGKAVRGACVFAQNVAQFDDYGFGNSDRFGRYRLEGLNSGWYELQVFPCGQGSTTLAEGLLSRLVRVTAPDTTRGANITLTAGGSITGIVDGGPGNAPQPYLCVDAFQTNGVGGNSAITDANGRFTITNLPAGTYIVHYGDTSCGPIVSNLAPQWYVDAPTPAHATVVAVSAGKATTLSTADLATNGAIAGTVTGQGSVPVPGICVTATSNLLQQPVVAVTGSHGSYSLLGLPPTAYRVEFSSGCGATGYRTQWYNGKGSRLTANLVAVTAATTTSGIDASMHK